MRLVFRTEVSNGDFAELVPSTRQNGPILERDIKRPIAARLVEDGPHTFASSPVYTHHHNTAIPVLC